MYYNAKVGIDMRNDSVKWEAAFLRALQKMREEMDLAWKDFFEKNPGKKEEDVWRRVEERLRSKQNSKDQDKGVWDHGQINPSNLEKQWTYRVTNLISARAARNSHPIISPYFNLRLQGHEQTPPQTIDDLIIQKGEWKGIVGCKYWLTGLAPQDLISSSGIVEKPETRFLGTRK